MKKSSEWVRQAALDKMLDQLVEERGCTPAELIAYDAAKALGIEPSGEFYKKFRDWKQRRVAERDAPVMEVPPHVQADFRETVDHFAGEAMTAFLRAVRVIGGDLNRTAMLRVADAERRAEDAQAEVNSLIDHWTEAEAKRDTATARVAELEQALEDAQRREDVLTKATKRAKTRTSLRNIPVHWLAVEAGFLDLVERKRAAGAEWVFDRLLVYEKYSDRAKNISRRLMTAIRGAGITDIEYVYHSFRHSLKGKLRDDPQTKEEISDLLTGHSFPVSVGRKYARGAGLKILSEAVQRVDYTSIDWDRVVACGQARVR